MREPLKAFTEDCATKDIAKGVQPAVMDWLYDIELAMLIDFKQELAES